VILTDKRGNTIRSFRSTMVRDVKRLSPADDGDAPMVG
jgi:hypothetical protein